MKFSTFSLMAAALAAKAAAEDLLFVDSHLGLERDLAQGMGYSVKTVSQGEWDSMTTDEFSKFKAIIVADPFCSYDPADIAFASRNKAIWSPAILGNIIVTGTDPSLHRKTTLIENSIKFAASGVSTKGNQLTGLYFSLSCYYDRAALATVDALSEFGEFTVRGQLGCYNDAHIVASSPALGSLNDHDLSSWSCSVHEAFASYPSEGLNGFTALASARNVIGLGSQTFGDETIGLPYIISRGATPAGCGDGEWNDELSEECDDGNTENGDGCSLSCKCESGRPKGDGTCLPAEVCGDNIFQSHMGEECDGSEGCNAECKCIDGLPRGDGTCEPLHVTVTDRVTETDRVTATETTTTIATTVAHLTSTVLVSQNVTSTLYYNTTAVYNTTATFLATVTDTVAPSTILATTTAPGSTTTVFVAPPYATPSVGTGPVIIGVEVIVIVVVIVDCEGDKTSYITETKTHERPIWNTAKPGYPCYVCAKPDLASTSEGCFMTATTTSSCTIGASTGIAHPTGGVYPTSIPSIGSGNGSSENKPPVVKKCKTCAEETLDTCPKIPAGLPTAHIPVIEIEYTAEVPHIHKQTSTGATGPAPTEPAHCHGDGCPVVSAPAAPYPTGGPAVVAPYPTGSVYHPHAPKPTGVLPEPVVPCTGAECPGFEAPAPAPAPEGPEFEAPAPAPAPEAPIVVVPVPLGTGAPSAAPTPSGPIFTGAASSNTISEFVGAAAGLIGLALLM